MKRLQEIANTLEDIGKELRSMEQIWAEELAERQRLGLKGAAAIEHYNTWIERHAIEQLNPRWDEARNAVFVPLIGKWLDAKNLCDKVCTWKDATRLAKAAGKELISKKDIHTLIFFKDEINDILRAHDGDLLEGWFWSSLDSGIGGAWNVNFGNGYVCIRSVYNPIKARAVTD